jgi:hypothetical protein
MNTKQVITIPLQNEEQTYVPQFALFEMINGKAVMTPCDADGNLLDSESAS